MTVVLLATLVIEKKTNKKGEYKNKDPHSPSCVLEEIKMHKLRRGR